MRDHLLKGYSVNERRLNELRQSLRLVEQVLDQGEVTLTKRRRCCTWSPTMPTRSICWTTTTTSVWRPGQPTPIKRWGSATKKRLRSSASCVRSSARRLFGREKDDSLHSSLNAILQTFDGQDVYPSLEEKAAHLLYFLVKNHSFVDGNKRIAAALFLWFMQKNALLRREDGTKRIADNALVAMTLLIAVSEPAEKRVIVALVVNMINSRN